MHVDDCADGIIYLTDKFHREKLSCCVVTEITTRETAEIVAEIVGFKGPDSRHIKARWNSKKIASDSIMKGCQPKLNFKDSLEKHTKILK